MARRKNPFFSSKGLDPDDHIGACLANLTLKEIDALFDGQSAPDDCLERDGEPQPGERAAPAPPPIRTDETRALELSDVPWVETDRKKRKSPPPGRHVSSRHIFLALISCGGAMSAAAAQLGLSPQTLKRRLAHEDYLRWRWLEIADRYRKPVPVKPSGTPGPKYLRLCTPEEIAEFSARLEKGR